jgi:hypothetical protein
VIRLSEARVSHRKDDAVTLSRRVLTVAERDARAGDRQMSDALWRRFFVAWRLTSSLRHGSATAVSAS